MEIYEMKHFFNNFFYSKNHRKNYSLCENRDLDKKSLLNINPFAILPAARLLIRVDYKRKLIRNRNFSSTSSF